MTGVRTSTVPPGRSRAAAAASVAAGSGTCSNEWWNMMSWNVPSIAWIEA